MAYRRFLAHAAVGGVAYNIGYRTGVHDDGDVRRVFERDANLKAELLDHLKHRAYVKLAPSRIAGVGVFAIVDIPSGTDPFAAPNASLRGTERSIAITASELEECPPAVAELVHDFHEIQFGINATGMVSMDSSWYLNHGEQPNMEPYRSSSSAHEFNAYRTTRRVLAGEELLLDYRTALPNVYAQFTGTGTG